MPFVQRVIEPKFLSRTSLFTEDGKPRINDDELEAVTNNTLTNALRQLASLALVANDIFVDLAKQLQIVTQRSDALKSRIGVLEERVTTFDPKKVAVPRNKFPELLEHDFRFCEGDGTIIEEDVLSDYVTSRNTNKDNPLTLYILKVHMSGDGDSISTISVISDNTDIIMEGLEEFPTNNTVPAKPSSSSIISNAEWKNIICNEGGKDIFTFYDKEGLLSNTLRQKLVKITCNLLRTRYTIKCPEIQKINLARSIIELFPNLKDNVGDTGHIEEDFWLLYEDKDTNFPNFSESIVKDADKILNAYKLSTKNADPEILNDSSDIPNWDKTTRALLAILHMLRTRGAVEEEKLIVFKPVNIPIQEVIEERKSLQPLLLAQGTNKKAITQYNILVDGKSIECPQLCTSGKAFEDLFMSHWVLNTEYDAVSDICTFARLKDHYKIKHEFATNLFSAATRPSAVQALYDASAKTPIPIMRQMDRLRRDGHRSSRFFVCTPILGAKRKRIKNLVDFDIESRLPAAVEDLRRWTSSEALGDITVAPDCLSRIAPNVTNTDGHVTDGPVVSDDEGIDHKLPSPEEQFQVVALKFPAEIVAVDITGKPFNRMSIQRRSLLHGDVTNRTETDTQRRHTRQRKPRSRRRNTLAGTDQKEIQTALIAGEVPSTSVINNENEFISNCAVGRSKSSDPLRSSPKKDSSLENKKSHFHTLKQWGKNRLRILNKSLESPPKSPEESKIDDPDLNLYEKVTVKRKRSFNKDKKISYERKNSCSSSEKSSINVPIPTPLSAAVKLRDSSTQRRLRRSGAAKDEPHSSSGNWSASSESGRTSIGSEVTTTTQPKSTTSNATSINSLNAPNSVNSRRKFNINTSGSSSITSEGTLTPDIHDFHEDETSSVYSCDTEGYYTSFHMDSGLKTLKEEDMPVTPLHSTTAFSNSSSSNTVINAENEYELFGKGSTSTTASSAGTVCTTLRASSKSLVVGPAVPERKSSLSKLSNKDNSPASSLEREFGSEKTGTVKRSPASIKSTVIAMIHQQVDGDVSPDSGHNTSSSPIESANSPNGIRSGSEFEFSECSDMEGPDRIERIRVKTTINSSRIPSMCVITPPHSDDESVKSNKQENKYSRKRNEDNKNNNFNRKQLDLPMKPMETDLDDLVFTDSCNTPSSQVQLININPISGYATIESVNNNNICDNQNKIKTIQPTTNVRAASPSGGSVIVKDEVKTQTRPVFKATLLPFNNVLGKLKSNFQNFTKKDSAPIKFVDQVDSLADEFGDYVTIADVRNNNEKMSVRRVEENVSPKLNNTEYVSLNELPCNTTDDNTLSASNSLERKRRQGARVTLDAEGKVVYSSDSLKRRKGAHSTFEPGPYVKESNSPIPDKRSKAIRPVKSSRQQEIAPPKNNSIPLSPQLGKLVIRAASGTTSPTSEIVRVPPSTIVTPTVRPTSPKPNNSRGAYVHMQDARGCVSPSFEKEPVRSPPEQPSASKSWTMQNPAYRSNEFNTQGYENAILDANLHHHLRENLVYRTLPSRKTQFIENYISERPITPDIMRGLPHKVTSFKNNPLLSRSVENKSEFFSGREPVQKLGIPVRIPQVGNFISSYKPVVPSSPQFHHNLQSRIIEPERSPQHTIRTTLSPVPQYSNDSLKISPIDPRNVGEFKSSTPSSRSYQEIKSAVNLESILLSPKKSTMSTEELYAVIHKGKKKLNVETTPVDTKIPVAVNKTPEHKSKPPESGYLNEKTRSRFSWSPSDGEYVDYNTNIDKLTPSPDAGSRQSWACNDRKGNQQTSRLDFKKLLLQQSSKTNLSPAGNKQRISAVEQLKLSKQQVKPPTSSDVNILELSRSPKSFQNRRLGSSNLPTSPKHDNKQRPMPKIMSPRSQWRFANPRSDVLSSTIPEDCGEDESPNSSFRKSASPTPRKLDFHVDNKYGLRATNTDQNYKTWSLPTTNSRSTSISQQIRAQRAQFFDGQPVQSTFGNNLQQKTNLKESKVCSSPPTLETAF